MRINIVLGPFLSIPPAPCGAVERIWYDLAQEFASRGHEICLIYKSHPEVTEIPGNIQGIPVRGYESTGNTGKNLLLDFTVVP